MLVFIVCHGPWYKDTDGSSIIRGNFGFFFVGSKIFIKN